MSEGNVATSSNRTFVALPGHFGRRPGRWPSPPLNCSPMISLGMLPRMKSGRRRPVTSRIEWANWEFSSCCFCCFECTEHARNETNEKTDLINSVENRIWKKNMRNGVVMRPKKQWKMSGRRNKSCQNHSCRWNTINKLLASSICMTTFAYACDSLYIYTLRQARERERERNNWRPAEKKVGERERDEKQRFMVEEINTQYFLSCSLKLEP